MQYMKPLKHLVLAAAVALSVCSARAAYQIQFNTLNDPSAPTNPVFDLGGTTKLLGSAGFVGQLYVQVGAGAFNAIGTSQSFFNGGAAGFIAPALPDITVPDASVLNTTSANYQLRVWNTANGSTYEAASAVNGAHVGSSSSVAVSLLGYNPSTQSAPIGYPQANGFSSFSLSVVSVPEPATIALGLFGAAGMLIRRRK